MTDQLILFEGNQPQFVKDPDTGELLAVDRADERYRSVMSRFWADECPHTETQIMRVSVAGGATQVRECCTNCGERRGQALPQSDKGWVRSLPHFLGDTTESYRARRDRERHAILLELARIQFDERGKFTNHYREYMKSPQWFAKRDLVLKRCGGVCEGCGTNPATEAHHITYQHFGNEFLFELRGLCHGCHEFIHAEGREPMDDDSVKDEAASNWDDDAECESDWD